LTTLSTKRKSWPLLHGEQRVVGLEQPVEIRRDALGVPHIRAETEADAYFALGVVHAQDRAFQADFSRRLATGRLAEVIGEGGAEYDAFMAGLFLQERATELLSAMDEASRRRIEAYARGFNQGLEGLRAPPVEYRLLGLQPAPWTPEDTLAITFLNSLGLSQNLSEELAVLSLAPRVDAELADLLYRSNPKGPPIDAHYERLREIDLAPYSDSFRAFRRFLGSSDPAASNNWVVGPTRSADGMPILANDPHLTQSVPSVWYLADVQGGALHAAGGTMPGAPFVIIGHNGQVAWGFTNLMADYIDLAVVELVDGGYRLAGEVLPFEERAVVVSVRDAPSQTHTVPWTRVGPLITTREGEAAVALRWHLFELEDHTVEFFDGLQHAESARGVTELSSIPSILSFNLVSADTDGHYGWAATGSVPRRLDHSGRIPYLASEVGSGWDGYLADLPHEIDPFRGFVLSANAQTGSLLDNEISSGFVPGWRQRRIAVVLAESEEHTPEDSQVLQLDRLDLQARSMVPRLMGLARPRTQAATDCRELLLAWDGVADTESVGPSVWAATKRAILRELLVERLGVDGVNLYLRVWGNRGTPLDTDLTLFTDDPERAVSVGLTAACENLSSRYGEDLEGWRWGELHHLHLRHPFGGRVKLLSKWNMFRTPWGGSATTVNAAGYSLASDEWGADHMASLRMVVPMSDPGSATLVHPGGQSGQPGHPHYRSHFGPFVQGDTTPLWFNDADVLANTVHILRLVPEP